MRSLQSLKRSFVLEKKFPVMVDLKLTDILLFLAGQSVLFSVSSPRSNDSSRALKKALNG